MSVVLNSGGNKKINVPKIVATFVYASSQGQRKHSARTNRSRNPLDLPDGQTTQVIFKHVLTGIGALT